MKKRISTIFMALWMTLCCGSFLHATTPPSTNSTNAITTLPHTEDFEGYNTGDIPTGWTTITNTASGREVNITDFRKHEGTKSFQLNNWGAYKHYYLISPEITVASISSLEMSFYAYFSGDASCVLQVGVMSNPADTNSFVPIANFSEVTNSFVEKIVSFENYIGTGEHIAFRWKNTTSHAAVYIDDISIDATAACARVSDLHVGHISGTSAQATWQHAGSPLYYNIEYGMVDDENGTTTILTIPDAYYNFTNLEERSRYFFAVRAVCANGESAWDTTYFSTLCNTFAGPEVVNGTRTSNELPITNFAYSYSQQIYTLADLDSAATDISVIAIQYPSNVSITKNLEIYLAHTDNSHFAVAGSWIPYADLTCYFSGNVLLNNEQEDQWAYILLDSAFHFNGTQNLVVGFYDRTGRTGSMQFATDTTLQAQAILIGSSIAIDPSTFSGAGSRRNFRNNMRFLDCFSMSCMEPRLLQTTYIGGEDADISWIEAGTSTHYLIEYKTSLATDWEYAGNASSTSFTLTNLTPLTDYMVRVRALCSEMDSSNWSPTLSFTTRCPAFELPLYYHFDSLALGSAPDCWTIYSTLPTQPGTVQNDARSLPAAFSFGSTTGGYALTSLPELDLTDAGNSISVSFWGKSASDNSGYFVLGTLAALDVPDSFITLDTILFANDGQWEEFYFQYPKSDFENQFLTFKSWNAGLVIIDNLLVESTPTCLSPNQLIATTTSHNSITIDWNERNGASEWIVVYGVPGFDPDSDTTAETTITKPYTITGLSSNTIYEIYVRALCSETDSSAWNHFTAGTDCDVILQSQIPYSENFDHIGLDESALPECWKRFSTFDNSNPILSTINHSSPAAMRFTSDTGTYSMLVMRAFEEDIDLNDLVVRFQFRGWGDSPVLQVGIMTDGNDPASFTSVGTHAQGFNDWRTGEISLASYSGEGRYLAFKAEGAGNSFHLDDILIDFAPTCFAPTQIIASNVHATYMDLSWTPAGTDTAWVVTWTITGHETSWSEAYVTGTPSYRITDLTSSRSYSFKVKAICAEGDTSFYSNPSTAITRELCTEAPANLTITSATHSNASFSWDIMEEEDRWEVRVETENGILVDSAEVTLNSYTASDLSPATAYRFSVKAICDAANSSPVSTISFSTSAIPTYTITASSGANGTITPSGNITVNEGDDITFTFKANDNYVISSVLVDNVAQPADTFYTFTSVNANHTIQIDFAVGIDDFSDQNSVKIYPNPTNGIIRIDMDQEFHNLQIADITGKVLFSQPINGKVQTLDITSYPAGLYFITLTSKEGKVTRKVARGN